MKILRGVVPISKCALETLSLNHWLRKEQLIIQDKHCGCPDCVKRAEQIEIKEEGRKVKVGELFRKEV